MSDDFDVDPADDPNGPEIFERTCNDCGETFHVNLYLQSNVSPDSMLSVCSQCLKKMIERGRRSLQRRGLLDE